MNQELESLMSDYGGGRKKATEKSQLFNDLAKEVLFNFNDKSYREIELFCEYLKQVSKLTSVYKHYGIEQPINQVNKNK